MHNKLNLRLTTIDDYTELCDWWNWWPSWDIPPTIDILDNLKYGIIISYNNQNVCAGFIYFTNAKGFGLLEYVVSTYKVKDKSIRKEALELLIVALLDIAKKQGVHTVFSSLQSDHLIKIYKDCGFQTGSQNTTEMIARL